MSMEVSTTALEGVLLFETRVFSDARGALREVWSRRRYRDAGLDADFVQQNHSHSKRGVLRGLHYQIQQPQGKLVQPLVGTIYDVAVDLRAGSPTFRHWFGAELSAESGQQLYVPPGFAHGFYVLSETADVVYLCTDFYAPEFERSVIWNDPELAIDWPLVGDPIISDKDQKAPRLCDAEVFHDV